jgi:hypothetical protein
MVGVNLVFFSNFVNIKNLVKFSQILSNLVEFTIGKKIIGQKHQKFCPQKNHQFQHQVFFFNFVMLKKNLNLPMKPQNKSYLH